MWFHREFIYIIFYFTIKHHRFKILDIVISWQEYKLIKFMQKSNILNWKHINKKLKKYIRETRLLIRSNKHVYGHLYLYLIKYHPNIFLNKMLLYWNMKDNLSCSYEISNIYCSNLSLQMSSLEIYLLELTKWCTSSPFSSNPLFKNPLSLFPGIYSRLEEF